MVISMICAECKCNVYLANFFRGGGNAQKSAKARDDALKKAAATKTPEERKAAASKAKQDSEAVKCSICLQAFMCTAKVVQLVAHVDSKHAKTDPLQCFPSIPTMQAKEVRKQPPHYFGFGHA